MNDGRVTSDRYREVRIETSTTLDLVQMAYDGVVDNLDQAIQALEATPKSYEAFTDKMSKAQQIVSALDDGIDVEQGELSSLLADFYEYIRKKMIDSTLEKSVDGVEEILSIVQQVRDFWAESAAVVDSPANGESDNLHQVDTTS